MHINSLSEYNELAKAYDIFKRDDNYPAFFSLLKREFIDACKLGRDVHSLEVGCGTGTFTHLFNEAGFNIDGVDLSPNMISVAQNKYPDLHFAVADISKDPLNTSEYGLCVALDDVLNCLPDEISLRSAIINIASSLTAGGYFLFDLVSLSSFKNYMGSVDFRKYEDACVLSYPLSSLYNTGRDPFVLGFSILTFDGRAATWNKKDYTATERFFPKEDVEPILLKAGLSIAAKRDLVQGELVAPDSASASCIQKHLYLCRKEATNDDRRAGQKA